MLVADDLIAFTDQRAAQIAGVRPNTLRYWELTNVVRPGVHKRFSLRSTVRLYDFDDTLALLAVAELRSRHLSLQQVRKVVKHLKDRGYTRPFSELKFATHGKEIYFQHADGSWEGGARPDQLVFHQVLNLELLAARVRAGAVRPETSHGRTERRPRTMGDKLVSRAHASRSTRSSGGCGTGGHRIRSSRRTPISLPPTSTSPAGVSP